MAEEQQNQQQEPETENAPGWRPQKGDRVQGKVVDLNANDMGYGPYGIVTIERDDGSQVAVHAFDTVLRRELAELNNGTGPKIGNFLDITFQGKTEEGGRFGRGYKLYQVRSDAKTSGAYDWSRDLRAGNGTADDDDVPIDPAPVEVKPAEPSMAEKAKDRFGGDEDVPF